MELSNETGVAIRATWDWFCIEKDLTKEAEDTFADYLKNIVDVADGEAKIVAQEAYSFWLGYCVTHACHYPRLSEWRFNGMYKRLEQLAVAAGAIISGPQPDYSPARPLDNLQDTAPESSLSKVQKSQD